MTKSSSASGAGHVLGSRYATALIEVANQLGALSSIENDMKALQTALAESKDLKAMLDNPVYSKGVQMGAVHAIAEKAAFHQVTQNFLSVLAVNGRLKALSAILSAFFREMERRHGVIEAKIVSAFPLSDVQQHALIQTLSAKTGKSIRLDLQIDNALLGGMVVTVGSRMIDNSLKTRLEQLKQTMIADKAA